MKSYKHGFTLIELLVVFAVMMVILSLLQPGLKSMVSSADSLTCLNHQRTLGGAYNLYAEDNAAYFPPGMQIDGELSDWRSSTRVITFDEAIINYLRQKPIPQDFIDKPNFNQYKQQYKNDGESVFRCPRHTEIAPNLHSLVSRGMAMQRSYVNIGIDDKNTTGSLSSPNHYLNNGPSGTNWSMQTFAMPSPQNTFLLGESLTNLNMIGYIGLLNERLQHFNLHIQQYTESPHGDMSFNFLYSDGHAENHFLFEFGKNDSNKWGPWTMSSQD